MSSLVSAPERAAPAAVRAARRAALLAVRRRANLAVGLVLTLVLTLIAFLASGGTDLAPNTWVEMGLVLCGCLAGGGVLLWGAPGPRWGVSALLLLAALTLLSAASILWSVAPDASWQEANRSLSYVGAFAAALAAARLAAERWPAVLGAVAATATILSAYALLVKVFPHTFAPSELLGRLTAPFGYHNATGLIAALGLPPLLWAGSRPERGRILAGLVPAAISLLVAVIVLSYSRSAVVVAVCVLALWFVLVPLRLRSAAVGALGALGGGLLAGWALHTRALTHDKIPLAARSDAGHAFGLVLVLVLLILLAAGVALAFGLDRTRLGAATRRRLGTVLVVAVTLMPLVAVAGLAVSSRGLGGQISHAWSSLTTDTRSVGDEPNRLLELGNSRPLYWQEGLRVGEHSPLHGAGAGAYPVARLRYTLDPRRVEHAHSYLIETFAGLGGLGLVLSLALLAAWVRAARLPLRSPGPEPRDGDAERAGMIALLCVVVGFGIQAATDWTWSIPGTAVPALLCAGWLAGRGPLGQRVGRRAVRRRLRDSPALGVLVAATAAGAVLAAWVIWQPLRAADADAAAIGYLSQGRGEDAQQAARTAVTANPLAPDPLWELAAVLSALGDQPGARAQLQRAVALQPQNPATWRQLGLYELDRGQLPDALASLKRAVALYPADYHTVATIHRLQARLGRTG